MTVADAAHSFATALDVVVLVALTGLGVAAWLTARAARRRYRRLRGRLATLRSGGSAAVGVARWASSAPMTDLSWWQAQRDRHRLWRAVSAAERAVAAADAAQAPVGDLPALARRLRRTAAGVDALLSASSASSTQSGRVGAELRQLLATAEAIRDAAVDSLLGVAEPNRASLADSVRTEVSALRHGLRVAALNRR